MGSKAPIPRPKDMPSNIDNISPLPKPIDISLKIISSFPALLQPKEPCVNTIEEERYLTHCESVALILAHASDRIDEKIEKYLKITGTNLQ